MTPVKGDRVEVVIDTGAGVERYEIVASKAGRRVEVSTARGQVEVAEVTRNGQPVRTARFMATRIVALVEHTAEEPEGAEVQRLPRRSMVSEDQQSLM